MYYTLGHSVTREIVLPSQAGGEDREVKHLLKSSVITLLKGLLWRHRGGVGRGGTIKESLIKELNIEQELMEVRK